MGRSNFAFIFNYSKEIYEASVNSENNALSAPRTSVFYSRYVLERALFWLYKIDSSLKMPYEQSIAAMLFEQSFKNSIPAGMHPTLNYIRKLGNTAVHSEMNIKPHESLLALKHLFNFLKWMTATYTKQDVATIDFDETLIPTSGEADKNSEALKKIEEQLEARNRAIELKELELKKSDEEIKRLQEEIQKIKEENKKVVLEFDYSEAETRDQFIDLLLREAGWDPHGKDVSEFPVQGMPNKKGEGYVDYVLWGDDGLPLALVEAKRTKKSPLAGEQQAKLYADCLENMFNQRPIIYFTNGYDYWMWDDYFYPSRKVQGFYNKGELQLAVDRRKTRKEISKAPINKEIVERYYQEESIRRLADAYSNGAREALFVMATGTGKTRVAIAAIDLLMRNNWVKRVLFLADRNALVRQAKNSFSQFLPYASQVDLTKEKEDDTSRIAFSTYPTMMNLIDDARRDGKRLFGVGHFDIIIIDEAHRSIYLKYQSIFEYFDSLLLGLTATPKDEVDRNTYEMFGLDTGNPTYAYELEQAIKDGYLVPPKAFPVPMKFQRGGIKYDELSDEEKEVYELTFRDEEGGLPGVIEPPALNEWLFNQDTVDKVLEFVMENGIKVQGGDKLGKTIIFAKNHKHAEYIKERFDKLYPWYKGSFLRIIDNYINYSQTLIDDFSGKEKDPVIAVSVDMLDTGIDIPEIVNLVFFKMVHSKVKFWQMIGRGTRLCRDLFSPGEDKDCFYVFDFCDNFEFFNAMPEGADAKISEPLTQKVFRKKLELAEVISNEKYRNNEDYKILHKKLLDSLHADISSLDPDSYYIRAKRRYVEKYSQRDVWDNLTKLKSAEIHENLIKLAPINLNDDEYSRRFDLMILNLQLAILKGSKSQITLRNSLVEIAEKLEEKQNIPSVAVHLKLIRQLQTIGFWQNVTLSLLEDVRIKLRDLIKFLETDNRKIVYTNFEDAFIDFSESKGIYLVQTDNSLVNYKKKVENIVRENENHTTIHKLKTNQPITKLELEELERLLFTSDGTLSEEELLKKYKVEKPLGKFVRSIVGLDRNAAKEAFSILLKSHTLTADQIKFIDSIINYLTQNGTINVEQLFEPPFTDLSDKGLLGIFDISTACKVQEIINDINQKADVA